MGLQGMINDMLARCDEDLSRHAPKGLEAIKAVTAGRWRGSSPPWRTAPQILNCATGC